MKITVMVGDLEIGLRIPHEIQAEQIGAFAIHPRVEIDGKTNLAALEWTVTHIGTGLCITQAVSEMHARRAAESLDRVPMNWHFSDPDAVNKWPDGRKQLVRDICKEAIGFKSAASEGAR